MFPTSARATVAYLLPYATSGLLVGCAVSLGWRYASPRSLINADQPRPPDSVSESGSSYYMTILDGNLNYYSGPTWFPAFLAIPLLGLTVGLIVGATTIAMARYDILNHRPYTVRLVLSVISGAFIGVIGAAWARAEPPRIYYRLDTVSPPVDVSSYIVNGQFNALGAPFYVDFGPLYLTFAAAASGVAVVLMAAALAFQSFAFHRRNRRDKVS